MLSDADNGPASTVYNLNCDEIDCAEIIKYFKLQASDKGYLIVLPDKSNKGDNTLKTMYVEDHLVGKNTFKILSAKVPAPTEDGPKCCSDNSCTKRSAINRLAYKIDDKIYFLAGEEVTAPQGNCFKIDGRSYVNLVFVDKDEYDKIIKLKGYIALHVVRANSGNRDIRFRAEPFCESKEAKNKFLNATQHKPMNTASNNENGDYSAVQVHVYHTIDQAECTERDSLPNNTNFRKICVANKKENKDHSRSTPANNSENDTLDSEAKDPPNSFSSKEIGGKFSGDENGPYLRST
ncbi:hypothetical protein TrispH2_007246 [Trichoplax sp. H2]|nr:hypothetical protein TrispH2_007246 [Trichoplax sp. H2]|eukprot:RDD40616.1 hypothetical protein TrispH2_007246 [Trichoplax sp. H2]